MSRRTGWLVALGCALLIVLGAVIFWPRNPATTDVVADGDTAVLPGAEAPDVEVELASFNLYFPGEGGRLYAEERLLPVFDGHAAQIKALVDALLLGPESDSLRSPLSSDASLRQVYLIDVSNDPRTGGENESQTDAVESTDPPAVRSRSPHTVVLDFQTPGAKPPLATGSQRELLMLYSLVNTVLLNTEESGRVLILWNGQQKVTFSGHIDTGRPLGPQRSFIASRKPPPYDPGADPQQVFAPSDSPDTSSGLP